MAARRLAALAILVAGAVHLELWLFHGYHSIHVIGPLFLVNAASAVVIAVLLAVRGGVLADLAGLGYAAGTLAAFFLSVYVGLFGFVEVLNKTPQLVAMVAEVATILLLAYARARTHEPSSKPMPDRPLGR